MRYVVLLFGLIAITITAAASVGFFMFEMAILMVKGWAADLNLAFDESYAVSMTGQSHADTALFLGMAAAYGMLGVFLSFFRCGWQGSLMLIFPALAAGLFNPISLVFSGFQLFVGLLSFLVSPLPIEVPQAKPVKRRSQADDDEDD